MRARIRRRSISILVSPGPREPIPPPPADPATGLPGQRLTPAAQPRQQVLQLGQLDLRLALPAAGVLGEDVEDQRGAVDDLDLERSSRWRSWPGDSSPSQITVSAPVATHDVAQLVDLARADVGGGVGPVAALDQRRRAPREPAVSASAASSASEFSASACGALGPDADQHDPLQAQLAVLDLGDVGELGGQPGDPAQRGALLEVELAGRRRVEVGGRAAPGRTGAKRGPAVVTGPASRERSVHREIRHLHPGTRTSARTRSRRALIRRADSHGPRPRGLNFRVSSRLPGPGQRSGRTRRRGGRHRACRQAQARPTSR